MQMQILLNLEACEELNFVKKDQISFVSTENFRLKVTFAVNELCSLIKSYVIEILTIRRRKNFIRNPEILASSQNKIKELFLHKRDLHTKNELITFGDACEWTVLTATTSAI